MNRGRDGEREDKRGNENEYRSEREARREEANIRNVWVGVKGAWRRGKVVEWGKGWKVNSGR